MNLSVPSSTEQTVVYSSRHRGISDVFIQYLTYHRSMIVDRSEKIQSSSLHLLHAGATQQGHVQEAAFLVVTEEPP